MRYFLLILLFLIFIISCTREGKLQSQYKSTEDSLLRVDINYLEDPPTNRSYTSVKGLSKTDFKQLDSLVQKEIQDTSFFRGNKEYKRMISMFTDLSRDTANHYNSGSIWQKEIVTPWCDLSIKGGDLFSSKENYLKINFCFENGSYVVFTNTQEDKILLQRNISTHFIVKDTLVDVNFDDKLDFIVCYYTVNNSTDCNQIYFYNTQEKSLKEKMDISDVKLVREEKILLAHSYKFEECYILGWEGEELDTLELYRRKNIQEKEVTKYIKGRYGLSEKGVVLDSLPDKFYFEDEEDFIYE